MRTTLRTMRNAKTVTDHMTYADPVIDASRSGDITVTTRVNDDRGLHYEHTLSLTPRSRAAEIRTSVVNDSDKPVTLNSRPLHVGWTGLRVRGHDGMRDGREHASATRHNRRMAGLLDGFVHPTTASRRRRGDRLTCDELRIRRERRGRSMMSSMFYLFYLFYFAHWN